MVQNLKQLREKHGLSQQKLAAAVGVSQQSINKYENHNIEPDIRTLSAMADYLHTSIDYLVGRVGEERALEQMMPCELSNEELQFVQAYRELSHKEKESIQLVIENYKSK